MIGGTAGAADACACTNLEASRMPARKPNKMFAITLLLSVALGVASEFSVQHPDPTVLKWNVSVPPGPGETVDGTLAVLLDPPKLNIPSGGPTLKLAVRVRLADVQPAPLGPLLFHCGGPGSTRSCITQATRLDPDIMRTFDVWGIDQRGIGDSLPGLECSDAVLPPRGRASYDVSDFSSCECAVPDETPLHGRARLFHARETSRAPPTSTSPKHMGRKTHAHEDAKCITCTLAKCCRINTTY